MALYKEDIVDIEMNTGVIHRSFLARTIGEGDKLANRFGVRAYRNGAAESLSGSCTGHFIRADGGTVAVTGVISGNTAYVELPQACYAVEGQFTLAIKVTGGDATSTLRIVDGVVSNTDTGTVIDPGTLVDSIDDLIDDIEAAVASIPADYSSLWTSLAPEFSSDAKYNAGDYVTYDGNVYRFNQPHSGSWNAYDAQAVSLGGDMGSLEIGALPYIAARTLNLVNWRRKFASMPGIVYDPVNDCFYGANTAFVGGGQSTGESVVFNFPEHKKYTISATGKVSNLTAESGTVISLGSSSDERVNWGASVTDWTRRTITIDNTGGDKGNVHFFIPTSALQGSLFWIKDLQIEEGETASEYTPPYIPRESAALYPTGDNTDRAEDIAACLRRYGKCTLTKGSYYVSHMDMPDGTTLGGVGEQTKVYPLVSGQPMITMGDRCTVEGISFVGAAEDITPTADFYGSPTGSSPSGNAWEDGTQSVSSTGYKHLVLQTPIPAGFYQVSAYVVTANTGVDYSRISFSTSQSTTITGRDIVAYADLERQNTGYKVNLYIPETVYSVRLTSGTGVTQSSGYEAEFTQITVAPFDAKGALMWRGENVTRGIVTKCRFSRFDCAGIILMDTGTPVFHNLAISDCYFFNNGCGILIDRDSEFNKITNCTAEHNYYGVINRGGNNSISNCGFDANTVGIDVNGDYGGNQGHGEITGCTINHSGGNGGYGLIIRNTGRMLVSNCNLYFSKIRMEAGSGNVVSNCGFGSESGLEVSGGSCSMLIGCMMRSGTDFPISITNNDKIKVIDCWTRDGLQVTV